MQMESWQELSNPRDLTKIFQTPEYAAWRSLREAEDSRYIGLAMPRFLARLPYGAKTDPVEEFAFEEDVEGTDHSQYLWANSAYAMGTNITRAFKMFGWCTAIRGVESGGAVEGLPTHTFPTDDGGVDMKCPTEIAISDRREAELAKNGFMPLIHKKNSDFAAFIGAQSLQKPTEYEDPDATANANLSARLPYMFAAVAFAHYLKCMVRDKIGKTWSERALQSGSRTGSINTSSQARQLPPSRYKARRPLSAAEVVVEADESNPGYYTCEILLRPHYQLEGLTVCDWCRSCRLRKASKLEIALVLASLRTENKNGRRCVFKVGGYQGRIPGRGLQGADSGVELELGNESNRYNTHGFGRWIRKGQRTGHVVCALYRHGVTEHHKSVLQRKALSRGCAHPTKSRRGPARIPRDYA